MCEQLKEMSPLAVALVNMRVLYYFSLMLRHAQQDIRISATLSSVEGWNWYCVCFERFRRNLTSRLLLFELFFDVDQCLPGAIRLIRQSYNGTEEFCQPIAGL